MTYSLLLLGALITAAFSPASESYWARQLRLHGEMNLPVDALLQAASAVWGGQKR